VPRLSLLLALVAALLVLLGFSLAWRPASAPAVPLAAATSTSPTATTTPIPSPVVPPPATTTPPKPFTQIVGGPIVALGPSGLSLTARREAPWVATFASTTKFQKYTEDGAALVPMKRSELYIGMHIRVIGTLLADGTIAARTVTFGNPAPQPGSQTLKL